MTSPPDMARALAQLAAATADAAREAIAAHGSVRAAARATGIPSRVFRDLGLSGRRGRPTKPPTAEQVSAALAAGRTVREIADEYGCTAETVRARARARTEDAP